jgi:hypothetical protein
LGSSANFGILQTPKEVVAMGYPFQQRVGDSSDQPQTSGVVAVLGTKDLQWQQEFLCLHQVLLRVSLTNPNVQSTALDLLKENYCWKLRRQLRVAKQYRQR